MSVSEPQDRIAAIYAALNANDIDGAVALVARDFIWRPGVDLSNAGEYRGREQVRELWADRTSVFEDIVLEPFEYFAAGPDQLVVFVAFAARGGQANSELETKMGHHWQLRDGVPVRCDVYTKRREALDAAGIEA